MKYLDTPSRFIYKLWPGVTAALVAAAGVLGPGPASAAEFVLGVPIPKRAVPDGTYRYQTAASLRDVVKFFKKKFKRASHVFVDAIDHPEAKVVHIRSGDPRTAWEGINLALYQRRVHISVIPRRRVAREARPSGED